MPRYLQIRDTLASEIAAGRLGPGDILPSETELMRAWSISRITARSVIKALSNDGLIYTVHGRGSFVSQPRVTNVLPSLNSYSHDVAAQGMRAGSKVLQFHRLEADSDVATRLHISPGSPVIAFTRLHLANSKPVSISRTSLAAAALGRTQEHLTREALENHSLYDLLRDLGVDLAGGEQEMSATAASKEQAELLELNKGDPLSTADRIVFRKDRMRIEYTRIWTRPDRSRWKVELGPMLPDEPREGVKR